MIGNRTVYWIAQLTGWFLYASILLIYSWLTGQEITDLLVEYAALMVIVGIGLSHSFRFLIIRFNWLNLPIAKAVIIVLSMSVVLASLAHMIHGLLSDFFIPNLTSFLDRDFNFNFEMTMNWVLIFMTWSTLYFTTHYFANYKKEEIKNLKMLASQNEIELTNLKAQLNPHFMFNAMNSIRALIDEDPAQAKSAITQLSAMLRGALQTGKRQLISLEEELNLVKSYLSIEKIRFEERLKIHFDIDPGSLSYNIPPLMLQTLVENGVKHGISSLTKGGELHIITRINFDGQLLITVKNSGKYKPGNKEQGTGIGLKNSERRLGLLYGRDAEITIENNSNNEVTTSILIPKNLIYENINN